jgi:hypothetical protein
MPEIHQKHDIKMIYLHEVLVDRHMSKIQKKLEGVADILIE